MPEIREIDAKSILIKHKRLDSWFVSQYGMNLYRGCHHNCAYCDGRTEKYRFDGEFSKNLVVKKNAVSLLAKELNPKNKRKPFNGGFFLLGGGVSDSYQPIEKKYQLSKGALELCLQYNHPVHILTKSTLVLRDLDLLKAINKTSKVIVSFSFSSMDAQLSAIMEAGAPSPNERIAALKKLKENGISTGIFLMPVLPFLSDYPEKMAAVFSAAQLNGVDFIISSGLTLKEGRQKEHYYRVLKQHYPDLLIEYDIAYKGDQWGNATREYYDMYTKVLIDIMKEYQIPLRIPQNIFKSVLNKKNEVVVMLDQIDFMLKLYGYKSQFGYAAYNIAQMEETIEQFKGKYHQLKNVGPAISKVIEDIVEKGRSAYYEKCIYTSK
jgi:DNA repair photolyase